MDLANSFVAENIRNMWRTAIPTAIIHLTSVASLCAQNAPAGGLPSEDAISISSGSIPDVRPIFREHCVACHGAESPPNGLRLDNLSAAALGGDTGRPIVKGTIETNEIYRRVNSTDAAYRMPKGSGPLSATEIETIRRWVLAGCPWSDDPALNSSRRPKAKNWWQPRIALAALDWAVDWALAVEVWLKRNRYLHPFL